MKNLILIVAIMISVTTSFAQNKLNKDTTLAEKIPLYTWQIDGENVEYIGNLTLSSVYQKDVKALEILKDSTTISKYGERAKYGVIKITLKKGINLASTKKLLRIYKIGKKYQSLSIFVDSTLQRNHSMTTMLDPKSIKNIVVATDSETGEKYISIATVSGRPKPVPKGEIRIRG